jgi:Uncharacterized protein conserved in bacteria
MNSCCGRGRTNFNMVSEFHEVFGIEKNNLPVVPSRDTQILRAELIVEEVKEYLAEFGLHMRNPEIVVSDRIKWDNEEFDLAKITKELADILYVVYGTGVSFGLPMDEAFTEVHLSNMTKLDKDGNVLRREDGKVLKSDLYKEPDMNRVLAEAMYVF